jgi:hypothetical protein
MIKSASASATSFNAPDTIRPELPPWRLAGQEDPSLVDPVNESFLSPEHAARFERAVRRFDEENARDPNQESEAGATYPREWLYARRLSEWIQRLRPDASEVLRLAARCQHLCRWTIPRDSYPATRAGYLKWRNDLKAFHARRAGEILREVGYPEEVVRRVQALNLKENLATDPECQTLEDALCLVFLQFQFAELARKTPRDKMLNAVQKVWRKMSPQARQAALGLAYGETEKQLLQEALGALE